MFPIGHTFTSNGSFPPLLSLIPLLAVGDTMVPGMMITE